MEAQTSDSPIPNRLAHVAPSAVMEALGMEQGQEEAGLLLPSRDPLMLALLVSSSSNLVLVLLYWTHLLYTACSHSSHTPTLFPHLLLLGLCLGSSSSLAHVSLTPHSLPSCLSSLLLPVAYSLIYSSLLVRLVYLRSLHKGVYLPSLYQALLLLFCLLVQISLTSQLLLLTTDYCSPSLSSPQQDLLSLSYSLVLLLSCLGLATLLRHTAEHYREARAVWAAMLLSILAWVAWVSSGLIFPQHYSMVKALGVEGTVLGVLLVLLLPRERRLTYLGKEGLEEHRGEYHSPSYWGRGDTHQFLAQGHNTSYMGFHRPTRVVPPASSSGSRTASYGSSSQAQLFRPRPFLLPGQQHWPHKQGLQDLYRQPAYCLPLSDVYSLSEKYRRYKPQYYQI